MAPAPLPGGILDLRQTTFGSDSITNAPGTTIMDSAIVLWATGSIAGTKITSGGGKLTINGGISGGGLVAAHSFTLASFSGGELIINGNITRGAGSSGIVWNVGSAGISNTGLFTLGGNNTGLAGVTTINRSTLTLTNSNALSGAASVTVARTSSSSPRPTWRSSARSLSSGPSGAVVPDASSPVKTGLDSFPAPISKTWLTVNS